MSERQHLPNRRACETFAFQCNGLDYTASVSFFPNGELAEIFLGNAKAGSHSDSAAKDSGCSCQHRTSIWHAPRGYSARAAS